MRQKVNIHELTGKFNQYRQAHLNDEYLYGQLMIILHDLGFSKGICKSLTKFFEFEMIGPAKIFKFTKTPIHEEQIRTVYNAVRKSNLKSANKKKAEKEVAKSEETLSDEKLLKLVEERGFKVCKPYFDEKMFAMENPELYEKYIKYRVV